MHQQCQTSREDQSTWKTKTERNKIAGNQTEKNQMEHMIYNKQNQENPVQEMNKQP